MKTWEDLLPPGGKPGTVPTDIEQATGLERFELLGKMQGIDVFDMKPLDASRKGTWLLIIFLNLKMDHANRFKGSLDASDFDPLAENDGWEQMIPKS